MRKFQSSKLKYLNDLSQVHELKTIQKEIQLKFRSISGSIILLAAIAGCASASKKFEAGSPLAAGQFEGTAAIRDKQKNKTHYINLEIAAENPSRLRINATATLGIYVGSFAINETEASLVSALEKKYYRGANSPEIFAKLTKMNIRPQDFIRVILQHPLDSQRWSCQDSAKFRTCTLKESEIKMRQTRSEGGDRTIEFSSPQADLKMALEQVSTKVEGDSSQFKIEAPSQFKVYQLN